MQMEQTETPLHLADGWKWKIEDLSFGILQLSISSWYKDLILSLQLFTIMNKITIVWTKIKLAAYMCNWIPRHDWKMASLKVGLEFYIPLPVFQNCFFFFSADNGFPIQK